MKIIYATLITFCTAFAAAGQNATPQPSLPPLPPGPLFEKRAPDYSQWVITTSKVVTSGTQSGSKGEGAQGGVAASKAQALAGHLVVITKSGKNMLRQTFDVDQRTWNIWCVGDIQITVYPDGKKYILQTPPPDLGAYQHFFYEDYSRSDFPAFEWIKLADYNGMTLVGGRQCIIFASHGKLFSEDSPADLVAYVDLDTRYPIALKYGDERRVYTFRNPPAAPLALPALVQSLLDTRGKAVQFATRRVPVP